LGGVAATPIRASASEDALTGQPWTSDTVTAAAAVMAGEGTPIDDMRASALYRSAMLRQALPRFRAENELPVEVAP
jgi:xanthine dehydrogenase small subunit